MQELFGCLCAQTQMNACAYTISCCVLTCILSQLSNTTYNGHIQLPTAPLLHTHTLTHTLSQAILEADLDWKSDIETTKSDKPLTTQSAMCDDNNSDKHMIQEEGLEVGVQDEVEDCAKCEPN